MRQQSDLRPYQERIATELYNHDEKLCIVRPGGGKTISALTAIRELIDDGVVRHALVVAPKRVARSVWPDEIVSWAHTVNLRYAVLQGPPRQRLAALEDAPLRDLTVIGIDLMQWLIDELSKFPDDHRLFDLLVIDEISKLRDPTGKRARALAGVIDAWKMVWGLSGTLRPNSALDLFMPVRIVKRGKLWGRSFYKWRRDNFYPTDYMQYNWAPFPGKEDQLNADIAPLTVTLDNTELPQLPELSVLFDYVELPPAARADYDSMEKKLITTDVVAANAAVATGKLAQIANGFVYDDATAAQHIHNEKVQWLQDLISDAAGPTLLIYEFVEDLQRMQLLLPGLPCLGPGVSDAQSTLNIELWNQGKFPFMAFHAAAGGHGLNLQHGGCDMAWMSPTWSSELYEQTIARLHRSGQTKPVIVRICVARDTVDEMKLNRVYHKMSAQQAFEAYLRRRQVDQSQVLRAG